MLCFPIPCTRVGAGAGFVITRWGSIQIAGVYFSPKMRIAIVEGALDELSRMIRALGPVPSIIGGDFNAHSVAWGSKKDDARGDLIIDWATSEGLVCLNQSNNSICIHPRGESVVDLAWAAPAAARMVKNWRVLTDVETMSDHTYIRFDICNEDMLLRRDRGWGPIRWSLKNLDEDMLVAAFLVNTWGDPQEENGSIEDRWRKMKGVLTSSCHVSMPVQKSLPRRATYWWNEEIHDLRKRSMRARRVWIRARRRVPKTPEECEKRAAYKVAKKELGIAISKAKSAAWNDLLADLDENPWGLAYKIVRKKVRAWMHPTTERLDREFLGWVTDTLFPDSELDGNEEAQEDFTDCANSWSGELDISEDELLAAVQKMAKKKAAPGPDGLHGKIIKTASKGHGGQDDGAP